MPLPVRHPSDLLAHSLSAFACKIGQHESIAQSGLNADNWRGTKGLRCVQELPMSAIPRHGRHEMHDTNHAVEMRHTLLPCHTMTCHVIPYHIMPCHVMPYPTRACPQCLHIDTVPLRSRTWSPRPPAILHRLLPCHTMPAPTPNGATNTQWHLRTACRTPTCRNKDSVTKASPAKQ